MRELQLGGGRQYSAQHSTTDPGFSSLSCDLFSCGWVNGYVVITLTFTNHLHSTTPNAFALYCQSCSFFCIFCFLLLVLVSHFAPDTLQSLCRTVCRGSVVCLQREWVPWGAVMRQRDTECKRRAETRLKWTLSLGFEWRKQQLTGLGPVSTHRRELMGPLCRDAFALWLHDTRHPRVSCGRLVYGLMA